MTQITLSDDLIEITAEINIYKQQAGHAVFEIGKRLQHVRDNDLAHGQWESWLRSVDIVPQTARKLIQTYEQFGNRASSSDLPVGKMFEMLSLPESIDREDFINSSHTIPSTGDTKSVDEMTTRELREVTKQLKEAEQLIAKAEATAETERNSRYHAESLLRQANNRPAVVQTKTVEVVPADYDSLKEQAATGQRLNNENVQLKRDLMAQREQYEQKLTETDKRKAVNKDLKKFCQELLSAHGMYTESILYNMSLNLGDREAAQIIEAFQMQYGHDMQVFMTKIKQMTTVRTVS